MIKLSSKKIQETNYMILRKVLITVSGTKTGDTYLAKSYPCSDANNNNKIELYEVPVYYVYIEGNDNDGNSVCFTWKALRFMPYYNPQKNNSYKTIGWVNSGLHVLQEQPCRIYKKKYVVHNSYSEYNGAIVLRGTFYIHAGPKNLSNIGWGAAGCVEIIGNFNEFKAQIASLSGDNNDDSDNVIERLVSQQKLFVKVDFALPPNIRNNFKKEVTRK